MKKSRFTEEQIICFLKQAEAGMPINVLSLPLPARLPRREIHAEPASMELVAFDLQCSGQGCRRGSR